MPFRAGDRVDVPTYQIRGATLESVEEYARASFSTTCRARAPGPLLQLSVLSYNAVAHGERGGGTTSRRCCHAGPVRRWNAKRMGFVDFWRPCCCGGPARIRPSDVGLEANVLQPLTREVGRT